MAPTGALAALAAANYQAQALLAARAATLAQQAWQNDDGSWSVAAGPLAITIGLIQRTAASIAQSYVDACLREQNTDPDREANLGAAAFAGLVAGEHPLLSVLAAAPLIATARAVAAGYPTAQARSRGLVTLVSTVATAVADAGRSAESVAIFTARGAKGYTRMMSPPACSRCVILAGRTYRAGKAFRRHPRCDCRHIPAAEDVAGDLTTSPMGYFRSLPESEQDRVFTAAGARAIRDSGFSEATMNQVVNARQGMDTVVAYGRPVKATTTGTTKRATYGGYEIGPDGTLRRRGADEYERRRGRTGTRQYRYATTPRLMPEEIYQAADEAGWDRAETLRQLRRFGYVT